MSQPKCEHCGGAFIEFQDDDVKCICCGRYKNIVPIRGTGAQRDLPSSRYAIRNNDGNFISEIIHRLDNTWGPRWTPSPVNARMWEVRGVAESWIQHMDIKADVVLLPKHVVEEIFKAASVPGAKVVVPLGPPLPVKQHRPARKVYPWTIT